jgi:TRAP-type C4-dicarboxylate transport system permease small subunit
MQVFIRTVNLVSQAVGVVAAAMIVIAVTLTCQMIFIRYFLNGSTSWQTEAVIYLMIGATLLGLPYVQKLKGHVNVDLIPMLLPHSARKLLMIASYSVAVAILAVMTYYGWESVYISYSRGWVSETVWAPPLWIPYLSMPLGFGLFALQLLADLIEILQTPARNIVIEGSGH